MPRGVQKGDVRGSYMKEGEITLPQAKQFLPSNMQHIENLTVSEYKFVAIYCSNGFDMVDACKKSGYECNSTQEYRALANSILTKEEIVEAIKLYVQTIIKPYKDRLEYELLDIYYKRATYKVEYFYDNNYVFLPIDKVPEEWRCCVDGVKQGKFGLELILPNRDLALQALNKFVTGQNVDSSVLPDEARKKIQNIYNVIKADSVNFKAPNIKERKNNAKE